MSRNGRLLLISSALALLLVAAGLFVLLALVRQDPKPKEPPPAPPIRYRLADMEPNRAAALAERLAQDALEDSAPSPVEMSAGDEYTLDALAEMAALPIEGCFEMAQRDWTRISALSNILAQTPAKRPMCKKIRDKRKHLEACREAALRGFYVGALERWASMDAESWRALEAAIEREGERETGLLRISFRADPCKSHKPKK